MNMGVSRLGIFMNPLYRDRLFLLIAIPTAFLCIWSLLAITWSIAGKYEFAPLGGADNWATAIQLYRVPLSFCAGLVAIFALFTSLHRLSLQSMQVEEAQRLNSFNIYFKQREEFDKKFIEILGVNRHQFSRHFSAS